MAEIRETELPGVGVCYDFPTRAGRRVGVVTRATGRRELVVYAQDDPDAVEHSIDLSEQEGHTLAQLLGGEEVSDRGPGSLQGLIEGLSLDWLPVDRDFTPRSIGDLEIRSRTGASIVAIVRGGQANPTPGPDDELTPGDTAVVVGTPEALAAVAELLGA